MNSDTLQNRIHRAAADLDAVEAAVREEILHRLRNEEPGRDVERCNDIFGLYAGLCQLYREGNLRFRAARFGAQILVCDVLALEEETSVRFHKAQLFHNVADAYFTCGAYEEAERFYAMADEEECQTAESLGNPSTRNSFLLTYPVFARLIEPLASFLVGNLNNSVDSRTQNSWQDMSSVPLTIDDVQAFWQTLDPLPRLEFLRVLKDMAVMRGFEGSSCERALNHPLVMFRMVKTIAHLCQLFESYVAQQLSAPPKVTLSALLRDQFFGRFHMAANGSGSPRPGKEKLAGHMPEPREASHTLANLLDEADAGVGFEQKAWRYLRVSYIFRNSTAHRIDAALGFYSDTRLLHRTFRAVMNAVLVVWQMKFGTPPS